MASNRKMYPSMQAFLPEMCRRPGGQLLNLSSKAGRQGTALLSAYCVAGHTDFSRALAARELHDDTICVKAICPGSTETQSRGRPGAHPEMTPSEIARIGPFLGTGAPLAMTGECADVFG